MAVQRLYALTICAHRKPGMSEDDYHRYLSEHHSQIVKTHLVQAGIVGYTMTHNTTETKTMMKQIFGDFPEGKTADYDCFIQILFRDVEDYIRAKNDPYYQQVIFPDHANFADNERTVFVTGWVQTLILNGELA
ncbi:EthD domain-containing protein [Aspergillus aurantiobrunneus]